MVLPGRSSLCYNQNWYILVGTNRYERLRVSSEKVHIGGNGTGTDQLNIIGAGNGINISRANSGSPSVNEWLGAVGFKGYATGNSSSGADARIHAVASHNHSGSSAPANLIFSTKPTTTGPGSGQQIIRSNMMVNCKVNFFWWCMHRRLE